MVHSPKRQFDLPRADPTVDSHPHGGEGLPRRTLLACPSQNGGICMLFAYHLHVLSQSPPPNSPFPQHLCPLAPHKGQGPGPAKSYNSSLPRDLHSALCHIPGSVYRGNASDLCFGESQRPLGRTCEGPRCSQTPSHPRRGEEAITVVSPNVIFQTG